MVGAEHLEYVDHGRTGGLQAVVLPSHDPQEVIKGRLELSRRSQRSLGILFVDLLNQIRIPGTGFPLGFWFAQQGSIYVFVALIFVYVWRMNRLDAEFGVAEE